MCFTAVIIFIYNKKARLPDTNISLGNSWGPAVQAGIDLFFTEEKIWFANLDLKWIYIRTEATLTGRTAGHAKVYINPIIVGAGVGRRF